MSDAPGGGPASAAVRQSLRPRPSRTSRPSRRGGKAVLAAMFLCSVLVSCVHPTGITLDPATPGTHAVAPERLDAVAALPLLELPPTGGRSDFLAIFLTGDGGWRRIDARVSQEMRAHGVVVIGWDTPAYFHVRRTPDEAAADLASVLRVFAERWDRSEVLLVGYSRGADVLPFMAARLPVDLIDRTSVIALLGLVRRVDFVTSRWSLLRPKRETELDVISEVARLKGRRIVCVRGQREHESGCALLPASLAAEIEVPGGHHFAAGYARIARIILARATSPAPVK